MAAPKQVNIHHDDTTITTLAPHNPTQASGNWGAQHTNRRDRRAVVVKYNAAKLSTA